MTSISAKSSQIRLKITALSDKNISTLYKPAILIGILLFLFYILLSNRSFGQPTQYMVKLRQAKHFPLYINDNYIFESNEPTNIGHIVIGIAGSINSWNARKPYIESWWQPNITKGYLFLDKAPTQDFLPWSPSSPPYRVFENTSRYEPYHRHQMPHAIRMVRVILEAFKLVHDQGVRWYVMANDDTILFLDNLVEVLSRYDHTKFFYIGGNSECLMCNFFNSFEMAFGGAGYAISYPLVEALAKNFDVCIKRYPSFYGSDHILQSCVADLGVSLTHEKGFHQIDLHKDLSGFLSSHAQTPFISLHHLDLVDPLFPFMNRSEALNHLMEAAKFDESRLLQQTICYEKLKNWSFSIAWGYSAQVYGRIIPPSVLQKPLNTFTSWMKPSSGPSFMFNTRLPSNDSCETPHFFFLESVERLISKENQIVTSYTRRSPPRTLEACFSSVPSKDGSFLAQISDIAKILVFSPSTKYNAMIGTRRECCDILDQVELNVVMVKYRTCMKNEILGGD